MLTIDDLARLAALLEQYKSLTSIKDTYAYLNAYCKWDAAAGRFLADHGGEMMRVYAAVLGAPEVWARPWIWEEVPEELEGQLIRLVPLGAGKGEG